MYVWELRRIVLRLERMYCSNANSINKMCYLIKFLRLIIFALAEDVYEQFKKIATSGGMDTK